MDVIIGEGLVGPTVAITVRDRVDRLLAAEHEDGCCCLSVVRNGARSSKRRAARREGIQNREAELKTLR